jgi:hypothetical protein
MPVDVKAVRGRRDLRFTSFDDLLADAENLVSSPQTRTLGNWPLAQLLTHLALGIDVSIDGIAAKAPWSTRLMGVFIKGRILREGVPPGFKLPRDVEAGMFPAAASPQEALESLRRAVVRTQVEEMSARHPVFGKLSHEEWTQLHLGHAALHLSFAVPAGSPTHRFASSRA